jgi:glycosyltransferase involved in cell wall biosynthesis
MKFAEMIRGATPLENGWQALQPRISVILPTYNRHAEDRLLPCIQSVLAQSFTDFELIIYDDGSMDGSGEVIRSLAVEDPRIVFIPISRNTGLPAVWMNAGILRGRGEYTAFTFDDNTLHPRALEQLLAAVQASQADVVHAGMTLRQADGRSRSLGMTPASLSTLELNNTIPNGAVLVHRSFWERFGLYDPQLLLRRVCDWELWLRALKQGAYFYHLPVEIGVEFGLTLKTSLGNSIGWDYKIVSAYLQDDAALPTRTAALLPENIPNYEVLDAERVLPYVRNWAEWDAYEAEMIRPFLDRHPEADYAPAIRHNRRYDTYFQPVKLKVVRPLFHPRKRILLVCEQYTRLASEWVVALGENPNHILTVSSPGSAILFDPAHLDQVIVYETAAVTLLPFLEKCHQSGVSLLFVTGHQTLPAEFEPLVAMCDDAFSLHAGTMPPSSLHPVEFLPCPLDGKTEENAFSVAVFTACLPEIGLLESLTGQVENTPLQVFYPPGELPVLARDLAKKIHFIQTVEPLNQWVSRKQGMTWLVLPGVLDDLTAYERSLLDEDVLRNQSILVELEKAASLPTMAELSEQSRQARINWVRDTAGHHPHGRQLQFQNLAAGVALRTRLARQHGKPRGKDVHSLVFVASRLFGGSEIYGFLTAWALRRIGFDVQICVPDFDHYQSGGQKMGEWLAEHNMPTPANPRYGEACRVFFDPEFVSEGVFQQSRPLADWIFQQQADMIFCSGFIPELILAAGKRLPFFAAFFPPWGYALNRMTYMRHYLDGLTSDTNWGLQIWGRWLPGPLACIPSLIESGRFQILNQDLTAEPVKIALVGTMVNVKGHRQALLAVEQLISEGYDIHLNIYGFELEIYADFIKHIKKLAERPLLKGRVTFHGFVDDALEINRQNHIIFSASLAEGLPQAVVFHQAAGLVPVVAPAGGLPEIVIDGQTGFLADGFETHHLVAALRRALLKRADWPRLVSNGRHLLLESATEQVFLSRMLTLMTQGLEIRLAEGRHYFLHSRQTPTAIPADVKPAVMIHPLNVRIPAPAASIDESRMVCGPSLNRSPLVYRFRSQQEPLRSLRIRLATFLTRPTGNLRVEIYPLNGSHLLRRIDVPAAVILDNAWMEFFFEPLQNILGNTLDVRISACLDQGKLAAYEFRPSAKDHNLSEAVVKLGRRVLPLIAHRSGQAVFSGEET